MPGTKTARSFSGAFDGSTLRLFHFTAISSGNFARLEGTDDSVSMAIFWGCDDHLDLIRRRFIIYRLNLNRWWGCRLSRHCLRFKLCKRLGVLLLVLNCGSFETLWAHDVIDVVASLIDPFLQLGVSCPRSHIILIIVVELRPHHADCLLVNWILGVLDLL